MFSFWSEPSSARITRPVSLPDRTLSTVPLSPLSSGAALSSAAPQEAEVVRRGPRRRCRGWDRTD